ncbi:MAG: energy-coupled thiamine transporter ThiT [Clostridia bacterium]|nr:energy-coupled thiamine transporter ThiT [Clostridia bacterium]
MFLSASDAFSALSTFQKCGTVFLYLTIGLLVLTAVIGILIWRFKRDKQSDFIKYAVGTGIGYSIALIGIMLFLKFDEMITAGEFFGELFWPIFALLAFLVLACFGALAVSIAAKSKLKIYWLAVFAVASVYTVVLVVLQLVKLYKGGAVISEEITLLASTVILVGGVAALLAIFGKKSDADIHTKSIVYAAVCIAMSFALSYIRFLRLPQGGSVTFVSILPLLVYSYMFGIRKGVLAGLIYGLLQAIQDPWILHPVQFLLDYPIAFAMLGLAGLFKSFPLFKDKIIPKFVAGALLAAILRYACHVITGIIVFDIYAAENFDAVQWGFFYNLFVFADAAIAIFAGCLLFSSKGFVKQINIQ